MQSQELIKHSTINLSLLTGISNHIMYPPTFTGTLLTFVEDENGKNENFNKHIIPNNNPHQQILSV